eukprot:CAMPEP_0116144400 /NCGR_PEP_ID=MMETSP0329-20121206/15986_1 /TAXON_ID=697910 /ORGANISM="Pseudo-nitzschia arenysensis, Strain B593" /LENGTH=126 /DNA_ID=CAMNT_0003639829 /DNA_START=88 /DNA_END=468 /DNA_ORIENTATION=+
MSRRINLSLILALCVAIIYSSTCEAFAPAQIPMTARMTSSAQNMLPVSQMDSFDSLTTGLSSVASSSMDLSASTLDPTTVLSDVLGVFIGTPIILLVPILAALGVAGLLAYGIVAYANPEVEDDEI